MKIKTTLSLLAILSATIIFTGCTKSPNEVVEKWAEAILDGNIKEANEYSTKNMKDTNKNFIEIVENPIYTDRYKLYLIITLSVDPIIDGNEAFLPGIQLKKINDEWKIESVDKYHALLSF